MRDLPIKKAKLTGTALPICVYCAVIDPQNPQLSGNVWMRANSRTASGRTSAGWQYSVCVCAGEQVNVGQGLSHDKRRATPVRPPEL